MFIVPISPMMPLGAAGGAVSPTQQGTGSMVPFADMLSDAVSNYQQAQEVTKKDSYELASGVASDPAAIAIHSAEASAALTMTIQLANRAVGAYKEIMQTQL